MNTIWNVISNFGDAAVTLPLAIACAIWIAASDRKVAAYWLIFLSVGATIVGATKILYAGCGIEIREIGFRVVSGHTMLSSAVWTTCIALFLRRAGLTSVGVTLGLAAGAIIGAARVFEEAHTVSEVVAGWALGSAVALVQCSPKKVNVTPRDDTVLICREFGAFGRDANSGITGARR
jgi:membrane-associated phospholipid phosphatase